MTKKIIIASLLVSMLSAGLFGVASADNNSGKNGGFRLKNLFKRIDNSITKLERLESPSLRIEEDGNARITTGEIINVSTGTSTITVKIWGLQMDVNIADAKITHKDNATSTVSLKIGDKVNVKGKMQSNGVIKATHIGLVQITDQRAVISENIRRLIERLREIESRAGLPLTPFPN